MWLELQLFQTELNRTRMAPLAGNGRECLPLKTLQEVMPPSNLASQSLSGTGLGAPRVPMPIQNISKPSKVKDTLLEHRIRTSQSVGAFQHFEVFSTRSPSYHLPGNPSGKQSWSSLLRTPLQRESKKRPKWENNYFSVLIRRYLQLHAFTLNMFFWSSSSRLAIIDK